MTTPDSHNSFADTFSTDGRTLILSRLESTGVIPVEYSVIAGLAKVEVIDVTQPQLNPVDTEMQMGTIDTQTGDA